MKKLFLSGLLILPLLSSCGGKSPSPSTKTYTVTWDLDNGSALFKEEYKKGEVPSYKGVTPTKERTNLSEEDKKAGKDDCSYTFKGWDKEFVPVVADTTYKAIYDTHSYVTKISFKANTIEAGKTVGFNFAYTAGENDIFVNWGDQTYSTHADVSNNYIEHEYQIPIKKDFSILVYGSIASLSGLNTSEVPVGLEFSNTHSTIESGSFFQNNQITSIFISSTIKTIDVNAFYKCSNLSSVTFEEDSQLEAIGIQSFSESTLTRINIPKSVKTIDNLAFRECHNLSSVTFEEDSQLEAIGNDAFIATTITCISIPRSVKTIDGLAFLNCSNLSSVTFEEDSQLEIINVSAFNSAALTRIIIPRSVKTIGMSAFNYNSNLSVVDLTEFTDESIEKIPSVDIYGAFYGCSDSLKFYVANDEMKAIFTDPSSSWTIAGYTTSQFTTDPVPSLI